LNRLLSTEIKYLPGVGPKKAAVLGKEANIFTYNDLLYYFPYKYIDRSRFWKIREINDETTEIQIRGKILFFDHAGEGRTKRLIAKFTDGADVIDLVWFNGLKYYEETYKKGQEYIIFGRPKWFELTHEYNFAHPEIDPVEKAAQVANGLTPRYHTTEVMKKCFIESRTLQNMQFALLSMLKEPLEETLPSYLVEQKRLMSIDEALRQIHFPDNTDKRQRAEQRLKFEELFYNQLNIIRTARLRVSKLQGIKFVRVGAVFNTFYRNYLPFELTGAQKRVTHEIKDDMWSGRQMNRLLQGDVGSGKTLVALMSMLLSKDNCCQACMMAPTEILANQHFDTLKGFLKDMDVRVELLTGSTTQKQRKVLLPALENGEIDILVGTHALIENSVKFKRLGLAVIDEQHRFGVEQRSRLWTKSDEAPHILIMTATPIPRTLAMTLYGDLDVSVIDELPPGRKPIETVHRYDNKKAQIYNFIRAEIAKGRQVYVVYPMIKENEKMDFKNLEEGFQVFKDIYPEYRVCMVHGKMKPKEKDAAMQQFVSGEAHILVATTVIEVGVNVPNATVMVIESAERFGLSQLHQLRGRVGRGGDQSYCILISSFKLSNETRRRLEIMVETNDGFRIAEEDLNLRGAGDMEGTQQSGDGLSFKIASLATDGRLLQEARSVAEAILAADPNIENPQNAVLKTRLQSLFHSHVNWGLIS